jgi:ABC-type branched-subunit amino acid transport system ATPase component/ABC-type branched-subunit amino acid transport system permease subunit
VDAANYALIGLGIGSVSSLLAMGLVVIYRGSGVVNFAHGGFAMLGAYIFAELRTEQELPFPVALILSLLIVGIVGLATHWIIMRPLRTASPLARVIATLGVLTVVTQLVLLRYTAVQRVIDIPGPDGSMKVGGLVASATNLTLVAIALVVALVLAGLTTRTRTGRAVRAASEDATAAAALGWSPDLLASITWFLGGMLAALAGVLFPLTSNGFVSVGQMSGLIIGGLAAALLAQFRSYPLAAAGGILIGMTQAVSTRYLEQTGVADSVPFLFIIIVLVVRGRGLPVRGTIADRLPRVGTGRLRPIPLVVTGLGALVLIRYAVPADWQPHVVLSLCVATMGLSVVVVTGYAGQLSLAQFALGGVGAFVAGRLAAAHGWTMELALLAGVLAAMAVGALVGLPALRTRGVNLAVVTFGLGFAIHQLVFSNSDYTGRDAQTKIVDPTFLGVDVNPITHAENYATLCLVALLACSIMVANVRRGRAGRRLLAVRTNERAAASVGVAVLPAKLYAFVLAAGIAGIGGGLFGFSFPTILYQQLFPPDASISLLVTTVIGGVGFVLGPVLGAALAPGGIGELFFGDTTSLDGPGYVRFLPLITGLVLLVTLIGNQNGVVDRIQALGRPLALRRRSPRAEPAIEPTSETADESRARVVPRVLEVHGLTQRFGGFTALDDVTLMVRPGEVLGLLGPNGAGKTTLIDAVTGYVRPGSGTVVFDGVDITAWSPHRRARAGLTRSFQSLELFDDLTVSENLLVASDRRDVAAYMTDLFLPGRTTMQDTVLAAIEELELGDILDRRPEDLSYGRRRLVAIARAVASRPSVLLLDEPAAGLDERESTEVGHLVRRLADDWGIAVLLIEHDVPMVLRIADRVHVLDFGSTIAEGLPAEIRADQAVQAAYLGESHLGVDADAVTLPRVRSGLELDPS